MGDCGVKYFYTMKLIFKKQYMKNKIIFIIKFFLFIIFMLFLLREYFIISIFHTYSNNYITLKIYQENKEYLQKLWENILSWSINISYKDEKCVYYNTKKTLYKCDKLVTFNDVTNSEIKKRWINYIKMWTGSDWLNDTYLYFYLDKKLFPVEQVSDPVIRYAPYTKFSFISWYLPFPISNNFFYIWRTVIKWDEDWHIYWELMNYWKYDF